MFPPTQIYSFISMSSFAMEDNILKIFKLVKSASENEVVKSMSVNLIKLEFDFFLIRKRSFA